MFLNIYCQILAMTKQQLRETIRRIIKQALTENQPATAPSKPKTEPCYRDWETDRKSVV